MKRTGGVEKNVFQVKVNKSQRCCNLKRFGTVQGILVTIFIEDTYFIRKCFTERPPTKLHIVKLIQRYTEKKTKQKQYVK